MATLQSQIWSFSQIITQADVDKGYCEMQGKYPQAYVATPTPIVLATHLYLSDKGKGSPNCTLFGGVRDKTATTFLVVVNFNTEAKTMPKANDVLEADVFALGVLAGT